MKTKDEIRTTVRESRRALDAEWISENSGAVERQVADLVEFRHASVVAAYVAMQGEVRTEALIERCWDERKTVVVPAYRRESGHYDLATMARDVRMAVGPCGILEPEEKQWISVDDVDLVLVPGLGFDSTGGRVGHGRGHYDRMMAPGRAGSPFKMGLAFEFQMFDRVPTNAWDVRMDAVVTEKRVIRARSAGNGV